MAKNEVDETTDRVVQRGGLLVRLYFDVHSERQSDLQAILADMINNRLLKADGVKYCFGSIDEPINTNGVYATSAIVTALLDNLEHLIGVVFTFAPAAVEVIKPAERYSIAPGELQSALITLSGISAGYSEYILKRVMKPEDYERIRGDIKAREELGKRIMAKGKGEGATSK